MSEEEMANELREFAERMIENNEGLVYDDQYENGRAAGTIDAYESVLDFLDEWEGDKS